MNKDKQCKDSQSSKKQFNLTQNQWRNTNSHEQDDILTKMTHDMKSKQQVQKEKDAHNLYIQGAYLNPTNTQLLQMIEEQLNSKMKGFESLIDNKIKNSMRDATSIKQADCNCRNNLQKIELSIQELQNQQNQYQKLLQEHIHQPETMIVKKTKNSTINIEETGSIQQKQLIEIMNEQKELKKQIDDQVLQLTDKIEKINSTFQDQINSIKEKLLNKQPSEIIQQRPLSSQKQLRNQQLQQDQSIDANKFDTFCNKQIEIERQLTQIFNFFQKCQLTNDKVEEIYKCININQIHKLIEKVNKMEIDVMNLNFQSKRKT